MRTSQRMDHMRKVRLDLDQLTVESFHVCRQEREARGTVQARQYSIACTGDCVTKIEGWSDCMIIDAPDYPSVGCP